MDHLFKMIEDKADTSQVQVAVSYLEIYNETIRDLLTDVEAPRNGQGLALRKGQDDVGGGGRKQARISVVNLTQIVPTGSQHIQDLVEKGNRRRRTEATNANKTSSRSHAVLQISVRVTPRDAGLVAGTTLATLSIIDLAGSERAAATSNLGARMKEGSAINKSLLALGNCINSLCQRPAANSKASHHVPYRDSKLTRLLEFSLGGNCKTVMIVCVSPSSVHYEDTQNTLKYANRAKQIKTIVSRDTYSVNLHVKQYVQRISELQATIVMLQGKLEKKSVESGAAEERKKVEAKQEMDKARTDVQTKAEQTREQIVDGAMVETTLFATEARLGPIRSRLAELDRLPSPLATPLAVERDLLRQISQADEDLLRSSALQTRTQTSSRSQAMFEGVVRAVSSRRLDKLDELARDAIHSMTSECSLQMELAKSKAREARLRTVVQGQAERIVGLVGAGAKVGGVVREERARMERCVGKWQGEGDESTEVQEMGEVVRRLGEVLGAVDLAELVKPGRGEISKGGGGSSAYSMPSTTTTSFPSSVPYSAASPFTASPSYPAPLSFSPSASAVPPTLPSSTSFSVSSLASNPRSQPLRPRRSLATGPLPHHHAVHQSPAARRVLKSNASRLGAPSPIKLPPKKPSALAGGPSNSHGHHGPPKKTFRWKDEAGEGEIDDASRSLGNVGAVLAEELLEEDGEGDAESTGTGADAGGEGSSGDWEDYPPPMPIDPFLPQPAKVLSLPKTTSWGANFLKSSKQPSFGALVEDAEDPSSRPSPFIDPSAISDRLSSAVNFSTSARLAAGGPSSSTDESSSSSSSKPFSLFAPGQSSSFPTARPLLSSSSFSSSTGSGGPKRHHPSPSSKRRQSSISSSSSSFGPVRSERSKRGRNSLIPIPSPTSSPLSSSTIDLLPSFPIPTTASKPMSALGGGARRVLLSGSGEGTAHNAHSGGGGGRKSNSPLKKPPINSSSFSKASRPSLAGNPLPLGGSSRPRPSYAPPTGPLPSYALPTAARLAAAPELGVNAGSSAPSSGAGGIGMTAETSGSLRGKSGGGVWR
jgi:kinesin family protein 18/19